MPSPILARADALMQRRRQGETGPLDDVPVLTDTVEIDDNPANSPEPTPAITQQAPNGNSPSMATERLASELATRLKVRLLAELPLMIEEVVQDFLAAENNSGVPRESD